MSSSIAGSAGGATGSDDRTVIMMVCLGNICRSPMAAAIMRDRLDRAGIDHLEVESSGTSSWHVGSPADVRAAAALRDAGYDSTHTASTFTDGDHRRYRWILAMDHSNYTDLAGHLGDDPRLRMFRSFDPELSELPHGHPDLDVPDPYYGGPEGFAEVLAMLERAADGFVAALDAQR